MDPNRFKNVSICFIIAIQITKPLSIPQQTIFLSLHMVINHEITIFDFSRFLFATLTLRVVKSRRGSNGPVYPIKRRGFFACYRVQFLGPTPGVKGPVDALPPYTPLVGLMDPMYTSEERGFFKCYRVQRTHVWRIRG